MVIETPTDTCEKDAQGSIQSNAIRKRLRIKRRLCIYHLLAVRPYCLRAHWQSHQDRAALIVFDGRPGEASHRVRVVPWERSYLDSRRSRAGILVACCGGFARTLFGYLL